MENYTNNSNPFDMLLGSKDLSTFRNFDWYNN